jgi:hypothetical protein
LSNLEATTGADNITVIIDSPKSGSFITAASTGQELVSSNILPATISKTNRVILTSTSNGMDTYLSTRGTYFSDSFFTALKQNADVKNSYLQALQAITKTGLNQQPWLDGNGDGIPDPVGSTRLSSAFQEVWSWPGAGTASAQGTVAPERGLGILDPHPAPVIDWVQIGEIVQGQATIQAQVRDDSGVRDVWMVIYPPDFVAPSPVSSGFPIVTVPTVTLTLSGTNLYTTLYSGFAEEGLYKIVVYAWDEDENQAVPVAESVLFVHDVYRVYLPMIQR